MKYGIASLTEVLFFSKEGFYFVELEIILSKLTDGFTCVTCIGGNEQEAYILNGAGLGSLDRFPPDCDLTPLPVSCAIC